MGCYCFLFGKKTVKLSVQCHILAQSPPDRRPIDKYPVNTSHCYPDLYKNISLQCYLVATVIHIQSVRSQIYIYIYICALILHNMETLVGLKRNTKLGQQWMPRAKDVSPRTILVTCGIGSSAYPYTNFTSIMSWSSHLSCVLSRRWIFFFNLLTQEWDFIVVVTLCWN